MGFFFCVDLFCFFVLQVWELTANRVIMVSAIGNDGPLYGYVYVYLYGYVYVCAPDGEERVWGGLRSVCGG